MKFSIITATKNADTYIEKTIESVISQLDVDFEHIIIDSVSTDNTLNIVKKYQEKYDLLLKSEPDDGISDAFNKGIEISSGDWIVFLGAGDKFVHSNVLSDMVGELAKRPKSLVVWGNIIFINDKGKIGKTVSGKFPKRRLKRYMCMPHQATFSNRKIFDEYGSFDNNVRYAMDYDILLRCYNEINEQDYVNYDVSYMLVGGISQKGDNGAIKDYRDLQIKYRVWVTPISFILYYWAIFKILIKKLINFKSTGIP